MPTKPIKTQHLTDKQRTAVELIVAGMTATEVATKLRVNRCTIGVWQKHAAFRDALTQLRAEAFSATLNQLRSLSDACVTAIRQELIGGDNAAAVALKVLQMIGIEKLFAQQVETIEDATRDPDEGRIAGLGRAELIAREIERLQSEFDRLGSTAST